MVLLQPLAERIGQRSAKRGIEGSGEAAGPTIDEAFIALQV